MPFTPQLYKHKGKVSLFTTCKFLSSSIHPSHFSTHLSSQPSSSPAIIPPSLPPSSNFLMSFNLRIIHMAIELCSRCLNAQTRSTRFQTEAFIPPAAVPSREENRLNQGHVPFLAAASFQSQVSEGRQRPSLLALTWGIGLQ